MERPSTRRNETSDELVKMVRGNRRLTVRLVSAKLELNRNIYWTRTIQSRKLGY